MSSYIPILLWKNPKKASVVDNGTAPNLISGLTGWWEAYDATTLFTDAGTTPVSADGDKVYQMNDKSGGGHHFVQSTEANRPLYKVNVQNGKAGLLFDNSDDYMTGPAHSHLYAAGAKTIIVVSKHTTSTKIKALFGDNSGYFNITVPNTDSVIQALNYGLSEYSTGVTIVDGVTLVYSFWHSGGKLYDQKNRSTATTGVSSGDTSSLASLVYLGGSAGIYAMDGHIFAAATYNVALSDADRNAVVQYFMVQLGIS